MDCPAAAPPPVSRIKGDVQGQGGLAHAWAGRQDDQVAVLEPGGVIVQVGEAAGHPGEGAVFPAPDGLQGGDLGVHQGAQGGKARAHLGFGHLEDLVFGVVQEVGDVLHRGQAGGGDLLGAVQEAAQHRLVAHQVGIIFGVGGKPHLFAESGQKHRPPRPLQLAPLFQKGGDGHQVHGLAPAVKVQHGLVNAAMGLPVKILGDNHVGDAVHDLRPHQDGPQHRLLGLGVGRGGVAHGGGSFRRGKTPANFGHRVFLSIT